MPFKYHRECRQHIPRQKHRVTNWREYDAALRNRGSLTIWFTDEALANWRAQSRTTPGGQRRYSDLAIETALTLRVVFRMALRQTEGLTGSIMRMLEIDLAVPDLSASKARRDDIEPAGVRIADSKLPAIERWRASSHRRQHGPEAARRGRMVV